MRRIRVPGEADAAQYVALHVGSPSLRGLRESASQVRFVNDSTLSAREKEAIRHFSAAISSCGACSAFRPEGVIEGYEGQGLTDAFYDNILDYRTDPQYDERERLAVEFCERYWTDHRTLSEDEAFWERLHGVFTDTELADLCILAGLTEASAKSIDLLLGLDQACMLDGLDHFRQGGRVAVEQPAA